MSKNHQRRTGESCAHDSEGLGSRSRATAIRQPLNWPLIRRLADYNSKAYHHATVTDKGTDAQALVTMTHDGVVVAFRGSSSPQDFLQDAKFDMEPLAYLHHNSAQPCTVRVHRGFLEDFDALNVAVVHQVRNSLATFQRVSPHPKIYITGHSLGGALAILCALEFSRQKLKPESVITFGQPRVGNATFAGIYNRELGDRTFHVINANDPVPLLPPLLAGYRDEGNEVFLPAHSGYALNPSIGFEIVSDVLGALASWRKRKLAFIPKHLLKAYLERIQLA